MNRVTLSNFNAPKFSEKLTIHFHMFIYLVACFLSNGFVSVLVTRSNYFVFIH